jgi:transcriptional regulator with XRE-family HTH domain
VAKKEYIEGSFGSYFVKLIKDHNYSQAKFAIDLGVSKTYLFDVLNGRVKPPTPNMQERIEEMLHLTDDEKNDFYSNAAYGRNELPKDIVEYLINNKAEIDILRERMRAV